MLPRNHVAVEPREDKILRLVYKMRVALDQMPSPPSYEAEETSNTFRLKETAKKVLASSVHAGSGAASTAYSEWGDQPEDERNAKVEGWIQALEDVERETGFVDVRKAPTSAPSESTHEDEANGRRTSSTTSVDTDGTFDIGTKLVISLSERGKKEYEKGNHEQATKSLLLALQHADRLRKDPSKSLKYDLTEVHFKLASIYLKNRKLNESEYHLKEVIGESTSKDSALIFTTYLKLGQLYLSRTDLKESADSRERGGFLKKAEDYCELAVNGCGQHLGENSTLYYEAIELLAKTYSLQGRQLESEAVLTEVPAHLRRAENSNQSTQPVGQVPRRIQSSSPQIKTRRSNMFYLRSRTASEPHEEALISPSSINKGHETLATHKGRRESDLSLRTSPTDEDPQALLASAGFVRDFNTESALIWAIKGGSEKAVHLLLHGFPVKVPKRIGKQERIIEKKADPDGSPKGDNRPLIVAITENRVMIAKSLLEYRADPTIRDDKRRTPLFVAAEYGRAELIKLIPQTRVPIECNAQQTWTPLHIASKNGYEEIVSYLLGAGAEADIQDAAGLTALKVAASSGHEAVVRALFHHKASLDTKDQLQTTALMSCVKLGNLPLVRFLLQHHASVNAVNSRSESALMIAVKEDREEALSILIGAGANLETSDMHGFTPLITACEKGYTKIVQILIEAGANCNSRSNQGSTALDHARAYKRRDIERVLERMRAETGSKMVQARYQANSAYNGYTM